MASGNAVMPLDQFVGGMLASAVRAQAQAAFATVDLVTQLGSVPIGRDSMGLPLLSMINIPAYRLDEMRIDFLAQLDAIDPSLTQAEASTLDLQPGPQVRISTVDQRLTRAGRRTRGQYSMSVKLRAVYEEVDAPRVQTPDTPDTTISYGHVLQASWHHGEVVNRTELINRFRSVGIVVAFDRPMRVDTLNDRSAFAVVRWPEQLARSGSQLDLALEAVLPLTVTPLSGYALEVRQIRFVDSRAERRPVELITSVETVGSPPDLVSAVMLSLPGAAWNKVTRFGVSQLTFVLRGDWITDGEGRALDGNHIPPFVPVRRSGNGTGGGDWISTLHVEP